MVIILVPSALFSWTYFKPDCRPIQKGLEIAKLNAYGLQRNAVKLVYSYQMKRSQSVQVNGFPLSTSKLSIWITPGVSIGPLLFSVL